MPKFHVYLFVILSFMTIRETVGSSIKSEDVVDKSLGPGILVDAFHFLASPNFDSNEELGRTLPDTPIRNTDSSVEYTFSDKATLTYMLDDSDMSGWADSKLRETIITMIAYESGISPYTLGLSESFALPENRGTSKKLSFAIAESQYTALQRDGVKYRYMIKSGMPDDLIPLEEFSFTKLTEDQRFATINHIMGRLIENVKGLGELGVAHGGIDLSRIYVKMDSNTINESSPIYLTDYKRADLLNAKSLARDWLSVVQTFSHLVNRAEIIKDHAVRDEMVEARNSLLRSLLVNDSQTLSVSYYSKDVSNIIKNLLKIVPRELRPSKDPRDASPDKRSN
jgi:hypothetical protein